MTHIINAALASFVDMPQNVERRITCPECTPRRKHKSRKDLAILNNGDCILYNCHHCGASGVYKEKEYKPVRKAIAEQPEMKKLTPQAIIWLRDRGISKTTAVKCGCYSTTMRSQKAGRTVEAIGFPYMNQGVAYASKVRSIENKDHIQIGSCQTFWLIDQVGDLDRLHIVEGELDAMAMIEAGVENVVSVPNGAPSQFLSEVIDPERDRKFAFIWNSQKLIEQVDEVYLCGDADKPGRILTDELSRRLGKHKCWRVEWPDGCKDANDTLVEHGPEEIVERVASADRIPVAGLYEASDFFSEVEDLYKNGAGSGKSTGLRCVDNIFTILPGTLTVITGIPASGKSEFIDQIMVNLAEREGTTTAFASFENEPRFHIAKLIQKRTGKSFFVSAGERVTREELNKEREWVRDHFVFIYQADGSMATMDDVIDRLTVAVVRHGINCAVIDPMNYIDKGKVDQSETQWVSDVLTRLRVFAQAHDVAVFLVAHPAKMRRDEEGHTPVPTGYDISGSANYVNKADFGLTIHPNPDDRSQVMVRNWKSRFNWAGQMGAVTITYDVNTSRYSEPPLDFFDED